jgi:Niemann-Pick C1 protein
MGMTMISLEVIPFLLLAIGVDNMFLISSTFNRTEGARDLPDKFGRAMRSVGPSITTAALCESLAFLMGSLTKMPALQSFCVQAAFGVFIDYLL